MKNKNKDKMISTVILKLSLNQERSGKKAMLTQSRKVGLREEE